MWGPSIFGTGERPATEQLGSGLRLALRNSAAVAFSGRQFSKPTRRLLATLALVLSFALSFDVKTRA